VDDRAAVGIERLDPPSEGLQPHLDRLAESGLMLDSRPDLSLEKEDLGLDEPGVPLQPRSEEPLPGEVQRTLDPALLRHDHLRALLAR
jgi:hypothetical protein